MKMVKIFAAILFTTLVVFSFQNCGPSQNTGLLGGKQSSSAAAEQVTVQAPFAYDMVLDTISYNSCVGVDLNSGGIHGIKMGVNEGFVDSSGSGAVKAGLKLRTDFLTYLGKNVSPIYPSTVITPMQIQYILQNSDHNKNAYVQYAIRRRADLSPAIDLINPGASNSAVIVPRDGTIEQAPLYTDPVLSGLTKGVQFGAKGVLLSEGPRLYNLYEESDAARPIEASFGYSNYADETYPISTGDAGGGVVWEAYGFGEAYSDRVRQRFNSSGPDKYIATMTFGNPTDGSSDYGLSNPMRPNSTDTTKAFGRSYAFRFESLSTKAGWRSNLLKQITESNLVDNTPAAGASWSCENYVIMKQSQWNSPKADEAACVPLNATDLQNESLVGKVKRLRRHYLEANWNIGLFYAKNAIYAPGARLKQPLCVVPKLADCYLPTTMPDGSDIGVNYDSSTECYLYAAPVMGVTYTGNPSITEQRKLGRCAQYASVCVRSSTAY